MDEEMIQWLISDNEIDSQSQLPYAAVVFMLVYGLELPTFLLKTSDAVIEKFPLRSYEVGRSSVYLAGSAAHGLFPNTINLEKDVDVVIKMKIFDIRKECHFDNGPSYESFLDDVDVEEEDRNYCESETVRFVYGLEQEYLNVEKWKNTPPGYVMVRKCRKRDMPTLNSRYVSSKKTNDAREKYWELLRSRIKQPVVEGKHYGRNEKHEPILSQIHQGGPAVSAFIIDDQFPMTLNLQTDLVFSLPYPGWPQEAESWLTRKRRYGWPPDDIVDQIRKQEVEMVPVGHENSAVKDYEWRLSFTPSELLLSRSLQRVQREIVHILKAVVQTKSYDILNLMYWESEENEQALWKSKNIGKMLFHMLDKMIQCHKNKHLPHYFVQSRNLLDRFLQPMIEFKFQEIPIDEYMDFYMLPMFELRFDPLGKILKQIRYRSLPWYLTKPIFWPFVQAIKSQGAKVDKRIYVDTLVLLAKAHLNSENFESAYVYAKEAVTFYDKLKLEFNKGDLIELLLTLTVCCYFGKDTETAFKIAERVERLLPTGTEAGWYLSMRFSHLGVDRIVFNTLYGRILALMALKSGPAKDDYIEKTTKVFSSFAHTTDSMLDHINLMMFLSKYNKANELLNLLLARYQMESKKKWYESSLGDFEQNLQFSPLSQILVPDKEKHISNAKEIIYDRQTFLEESKKENMMRDTDVTDKVSSRAAELGKDEETANSLFDTSHSKHNVYGIPEADKDSCDTEKCVREMEVENLNPDINVEQSVFDANNVHTEDILSSEENENIRDNSDLFSQGETHDMISYAHNNKVETIYNRKKQMKELEDEASYDSGRKYPKKDTSVNENHDATSKAMTSENSEFSEPQSMQEEKVLKENDEFQSSVAYESLDTEVTEIDRRHLEYNYNYLVKLCTLASEYDKLGLREKGKQILNLLQSKCKSEHPTEENLFEKIKSLFFDKTDVEDEEDTSMEPVFSNVFTLFKGHMIVTTADIPILDEILATIVKERHSTLRISPLIGFYHFRIQYHKVTGELEKAKSELELFTEAVSEITDDSQLILGQHYMWFGHTDKADEAFMKFQRDNQKQRSPTEQILYRAEQLLKVIQHEEPMNIYLNDLFH